MWRRDALRRSALASEVLLLVAVAGLACSRGPAAQPIARKQQSKPHRFNPLKPLPQQTCNLFRQAHAPIAKLSQTGCVDALNPKHAAPSLIPYDVNSPLWSDGAGKQRFLALPNHAKIRVKDCAKEPNLCSSEHGTPTVNGDWELPVGSVLMKTFLMGERFIETRLLMRDSQDTWSGYSYAWNESQTDAELLPDSLRGVERTYQNQKSSQHWYFPSRSECFQCHTTTSGVSLGLETAQMDRTFAYPEAKAENQLDVLARLKLFEPGLAPTRITPYPAPSDATAGLDARARSYLHANCSVCHAPGARFDSIDLRFTTDFTKTGLCNAEPHAHAGSLGTREALLLVPGDPARSILSLRMHAQPGSFRMPPLASEVEDGGGVALIDAWIRSQKTCL